MKLFIVLAVFVVCACAAPLKNELLQRANALEQKIKAEIKKLETEKREHLAVLLQEEEKRLETLSGELGKVADSDEVRTAVLESELINLEFRVENEINILQREAATQELLDANAKILKQWVGEEVKLLENTEGPHRNQAQLVARALRREEQRLEAIVAQLAKAQTERQIEVLEVELRAIEVRLYEALRALHFHETTPTARPVSGSTRPVTNASATPSQATTRPTTAKPATIRPSSHQPTVQTSARPSTAGAATVSTTPGPNELKAKLVKKATELENYANSEISRLKKENKTSLAKGLQSLELEVKEVAAKLQTTTATTAKEILELIESELYWLERRLAIETEALVQQEKRIEKLLAIAVALKTRIDYSIKLLVNTPVGKALESESKSLEKLSNSLKNAKDDKTIINLEIELTSIEKRVNDELRPIGVPTTTKF